MDDIQILTILRYWRELSYIFKKISQHPISRYFFIPPQYFLFVVGKGRNTLKKNAFWAVF